MTNKNKIINQAQKFIQKGQWDKAIKELQKLVAEDPSDVRTLLKLGDVHAKKGDREQATKVYKQVAESYSEQGFFLKAVAVYKQILKHDPKNLEVTLKLAELYEHLGLTSEAMVQYQLASQIHEETGSLRDALDVLRRMVELDAENVASRIKLAESYSRENMIGDAIEQFQRAAEILKRQGRIDDYVKVAERLVYHDPNRIDAIKELANIYLTRGDTKRGLAKLQLCFKAAPRDVETLTLLAAAFRDLGQLQKTVFVYRELSRIHQENGDEIAARNTLQRIIEIDPNDAEARSALGMGQYANPTGFGQSSGRMAAPFGAGTPPSFGTGSLPMAPQGPAFGGTAGGHGPGGAALPGRDSMSGFGSGGTGSGGFGGPGTGSNSFGGSGTNPQSFGGSGSNPMGAFGYQPQIATVAQQNARPPSAGARPAWKRGPAVEDESGFVGSTSDEHLDFGSASRQVERFAAQPVVQAPPIAVQAPQPHKNDIVQISKILTETDVYIKYGLREKALEHLRRIFELDPDNVLAYTKMRDIYASAGDNARAAEALASLVHIYAQRGDDDSLQQAREELERLAPGHPLIAGSGAAWSFGQAASGGEEDSIDITEDSDVFDLKDVETEEPATQAHDSLDAWLQQDATGEIPAEDSSDARELDAEAALMSGLGTDVPDEAGAEIDPFPEYPHFGLAAEEESSGVSVADHDIVESADESGMNRVAPFNAAAALMRSPFDDMDEDTEALRRSPVQGDRVSFSQSPKPVTADLDLDLASAVSTQPNGDDELPEATNSSVVALDDLSSDLAFSALAQPDANGAIAHYNLGDDELALSAPPPALSEEDEQQISDELDEAEFMARQGLEDEAREALEAIMEKVPNHPRAMQIRAMFDSSLIGLPKPASGLESSDLDSADLEAAELESADLESADLVSAELEETGQSNALDRSAFAEDEALGTDERVSTADVSAISDDELAGAFENMGGAASADENPDDHYDEGLAYKELNRIDDAIAHFQLAVRSQTRGIAAQEMIGHCLMAKNDFEGAINSFWTALEQGPDAAAATNLKFEIGNAYEVAGDLQQAATWYGACFADDPSHRDVDARLRALGVEPEPAYSAPIESQPATSSKKNKISYL